MTVHYTESTEQRTYEPDPATQHRLVVPANDARQGVTGHNVRYVLGVGVAAIVVIFAGLWFYYFV
jgi:hypothetical protein